MPHTPGPWDLVQHNEKDSRVGRKTLLAIVYSEAYRDRENQEANARLIAAAPDLLEACREWVEIDGPTISLEEQRRRWPDVVAKMKAAIAKTEPR